LFETTVREIEELIDLVEIEMLTMRNGKFADESDLATLKYWRTKLLEIADDMSGIPLMPSEVDLEARSWRSEELIFPC
jgi:hypothetical protein